MWLGSSRGYSKPVAASGIAAINEPADTVSASGNISSGTAQADWVTRTTASGVVQYVRFSGNSSLYSTNGIGTTIATDNTSGATVNTQQAGSANVSSFLHQGDGTSVNASWNASGGIVGDGCLHIAIPTNIPAATAQWFIPLNAAWTASGGQSQGFGTGNDIYIQFRAKYGPNWMYPSIGGGGKKTCIVGGLTFNSPGSSSSDIDNEFVCTNQNYQGIAQFYHHDTGQNVDTSTNWQPTAPAPYNSFGHLIQPALDNGSSYTNVAQRYSIYEEESAPLSPGCWTYREGQWYTVLIHLNIAQFSDGVYNSANFAELWVARDGETSYTKLYSQLGFEQAADSSAPNGPQALWLLGYDTNRTAGVYSTWVEYDQIIVSTQPIACPQVAAVSGATDGPSWIYTTIEANTGTWLTPAHNATAIANGQSWIGDTNVQDPLARTTNSADSGGQPVGILQAWAGLAVDWATAGVRLLGSGGHTDYFGNEVYGVNLRQPIPQWYRPRNATAQTGSGNVPFWPDGTPSSAHTYTYTIGANGLWWCAGRFGVNFEGDSQSSPLVQYVETNLTVTTPNTTNSSGNYWVTTLSVIPSNASPGGNLTVWDPVLNNLVIICNGTSGGSSSPGAVFLNATTGALVAKNTNGFNDTDYGLGGLDTTNRVIVWNNGSGTYWAMNLGTAASPTYTAIYSISMTGTIPGNNASFHWFEQGQCWLSYTASQGLLKGVPTLSGGSYTSIAWSVSSLTLSGSGPPAPASAGLYGLVQIIPDMGDGRSALITMPNYQSPDLYVLPLPRGGQGI